MTEIVVACIPSVRQAGAIPTLLAILHQDHPPEVILVRDESEAGMLTDPLVEALALYGGIEIHHVPLPPTDNHSRVDAGRHGLAALAAMYSPTWLWFVDDDVYPRPDCLSILLANAIGYDKPMATASIVDLVPQQVRHPAIRFPPRNRVRREHNTLIPTASAECFIVRASIFNKITPSQLTTDGEDLVMSGQLGATGGIVHAADAIGVHLRTAPATWAERPPSASGIKADLIRILGLHTGNRLWAAMGEK